MKAIGYVRVSTQGQAEDGVSLDAQEAKVRGWADLNGADVVIFRDEGISGKRSDNRPGLIAIVPTRVGVNPADDPVAMADELIVPTRVGVNRGTPQTALPSRSSSPRAWW